MNSFQVARETKPRSLQGHVALSRRRRHFEKREREPFELPRSCVLFPDRGPTGGCGHPSPLCAHPSTDLRVRPLHDEGGSLIPCGHFLLQKKRITRYTRFFFRESGSHGLFLGLLELELRQMPSVSAREAASNEQEIFPTFLHCLESPIYISLSLSLSRESPEEPSRPRAKRRSSSLSLSLSLPNVSREVVPILVSKRTPGIPNSVEFSQANGPFASSAQRRARGRDPRGFCFFFNGLFQRTI